MNLRGVFKVKTQISIAVLIALSQALASCSDPSQAMVQRDIYTGPNAVEDCIADWGDQEMCTKKIDEEEAKKLAQHHQSSGSNVVIVPVFGGVYGPSYSGHDRVAYSSNGSAVRPAADRSVSAARFNGVSTRSPVGYTAPKAPTVGSSAVPFSHVTRPSYPTSAPSVSTTTRSGFGSTAGSSSS